MNHFTNRTLNLVDGQFVLTYTGHEQQLTAFFMKG
jgi:hypothetical protein